MRSLRLGLDFVMLALLLRQVLATIRHSREIIITDAVGVVVPGLPGEGTAPSSDVCAPLEFLIT